MKKGLLVAWAAVLVAIGGGAAAATYHIGQDDRLPAGFSVGGWEAGGLSADEALGELRGRLAGLEKMQVKAVASGEDSSVGLPVKTVQQLGLRVSADEAVEAMERYRDRGWWDRAWMRLISGERGMSYPVELAWDDGVLQREVQRAWGGAAGSQPKVATRVITADDQVVYTREVVGREVDLKTLAARVKELVPLSLAADVAAEPRKIALPIIETIPKVTIASLKEEGIDRKIAEFTTSFATSAEGRSHNVTAAAKALNDTLLMPGDVFEYGKIVDKADKEYGYREAPVIVNGKLTPGVGGGICQVSSTLYNAILLAGLDVVERRNHSIPVHYLPPGLDATFADGYINFRFKNTTEKQLLIRTVVQDKHVTVKLFGTLDEHVSYRTETKQVKVVSPLVRYVSNDTVTLGQEQVLQRGEAGMVVDTFRIKLLDGQEVSRERLPRSSYRAQDGLIAVNPEDPRLKPQDTTPPPSGQEGPVEPV
ncbi:VanW family protein [Cohnella candidum]|uniref:Vanomycin resistance protein VanB n=1 Tax=Cohnella candidum TaxID=2674991 RepID=A0A3G3K244_9BACL|nr:VanW family protein [Cohnella candidum]AYQ74117.1 vanomycin resistance protein VanB [Cohnella candidum]